MLIDEIDASLHPILTAKLISMFRSTSVNPLRSQLIFTSHDAALLGTIDTEEILRRDEIWFAEKDADGASTLYPLTDFKPRREGENRQRRYLNGNYGAIPDLSTHLFEQALAARGGADDAAARCSVSRAPSCVTGVGGKPTCAGGRQAGSSGQRC